MAVKEKQYLRKLLADKRWSELLDWFRNSRGGMRKITPLIYDSDFLIRWRAVEALGKVSAVIAETDPENVREIIRRYFWSMNDESGNQIINAPEVIAEILYNVPHLIGEFAEVFASFISEEPFESGIHWGLARISEFKPNLPGNVIDRLEISLQDENPFIRYFAASALNDLVPDRLYPHLKRMIEDMEQFEFYDVQSGELRCEKVSSFIGEYIASAEKIINS
ncbi:MAG: hypothetical protein H8D42_01170 [Candidatus Marinimicrobia bacterium]|nr:hypothetical protein [Candidatus Neomarinimicrobiota bacterium]